MIDVCLCRWVYVFCGYWVAALAMDIFEDSVRLCVGLEWKVPLLRLGMTSRKVNDVFVGFYRDV